MDQRKEGRTSDNTRKGAILRTWKTKSFILIRIIENY